MALVHLSFSFLIYLSNLALISLEQYFAFSYKILLVNSKAVYFKRIRSKRKKAHQNWMKKSWSISCICMPIRFFKLSVMTTLLESISVPSSIPLLSSAIVTTSPSLPGNMSCRTSASCISVPLSGLGTKTGLIFLFRHQLARLVIPWVLWPLDTSCTSTNIAVSLGRRKIFLHLINFP